MRKKIKQSFSEKVLLIFVIFLGISSVTFFFLIKNKCLFVEQYNPEKLEFKNRLTSDKMISFTDRYLLWITKFLM